MPRLAPVTSATGAASVDVEDDLARDAAFEESLNGVAGLAPARLEIDMRIAAPGGDQRDQPLEHPGRAAALGQLAEDEQTVDARPRGAAEERARGVLDLRAGVAVGEGDDRAVGRDALDRGAQRGPADALDDDVELGTLGGELVDDLVGAEVGEAAGALGAG